MASEKRNYNVYRVTNKTPNAKRRHYYIVSRITDQSHLIATIRGMRTSSTANGGAKAIANDMAKMGKDYKDNFSVIKMKGSMTKHDATILRNAYKGKASKGYNTPRS